MKPLFYFFALLLLVGSIMKPVTAQDRPAGTGQPLPFQQDAPKGNEEQLAMQFFQSRDFAKAAELYEQLYEKRPGQYFYTYYFYSLLEIRDYDRAEKLIRSQRKLEPDLLRYQVDQGYMAFRKGESEKSKKLYDEALKRLPADQQKIMDLANAFIIRGENEYAVKTYRRGRELMNNTYPFSFEIASVYERTGDYRNTIEEYLSLVSLNPAYLKTVEDRMQNLLADDPEELRSEEIRTALLMRIQKEPENQAFSELMWWYSLQQKDFEMALVQAKSLDRRLKEEGQRLISLAQIAASNQAYDVAEEALQVVMSKGKSNPYYGFVRIELLNTRYQKVMAAPLPASKDLVALEEEMHAELALSGVHSGTLQLIMNLAHLEAFMLNKPAEAELLLNKLLEMKDLKPQLRAQCKMELADILLFYGEPWEATLLYQQVYQDFKQDVTGQTAKFKNAKLSFYIGEFDWARAQADILKAATSKFISNDAIALSLLVGENFDADSGTVALGMYARADLLDYRNRPDEAMQILDSVAALFEDHPILDEVLFRKAVIHLKQGRFHEADSLLGLVSDLYSDGILADSALMKQGQIRERYLNDREGAMACYQEILETYPGSVYAVDARKRYRFLRGDAGQ